MKAILKSFLLLTLICGFVYLSGCTSAESTTGKLAFQQKDYQKAEIELKKGLLIDKNDAEGWYMLGYSQVENGNYADSKESFANARRLSAEYNDRITQVWIDKYNEGARNFGSGIDAEKKKDSLGAKRYYEAALRYFQAATSITPDSLKGFKALGETYLALGQTEKSKSVFEEILAKSSNPEDAVKVAAILFDSGLGMMEYENYTDAAATFKQIISISSLPKSNQYYEVAAYNYGLAKAKIGEGLRNANSEDPAYKTHYQEALTVLEPLSATTIGAKDLAPKVWDLLVVVYASLGENQKALDAQKKAAELKGK